MELSARGREAAKKMLLMTPGDVQKSIWFCRAAMRAAVKSLIPVTLALHCQFGISRSATLALVALLLLNDKDPARALGQLLEIQPDFWPNTYLVSLVDEAFNLAAGSSV